MLEDGSDGLFISDAYHKAFLEVNRSLMGGQIRSLVLVLVLGLDCCVSGSAGE